MPLCQLESCEEMASALYSTVLSLMNQYVPLRQKVTTSRGLRTDSGELFVDVNMLGLTVTWMTIACREIRLRNFQKHCANDSMTPRSSL